MHALGLNAEGRLIKIYLESDMVQRPLYRTSTERQIMHWSSQPCSGHIEHYDLASHHRPFIMDRFWQNLHFWYTEYDDSVHIAYSIDNGQVFVKIIRSFDETLWQWRMYLKSTFKLVKCIWRVYTWLSGALSILNQWQARKQKTTTIEATTNSTKNIFEKYQKKKKKMYSGG